MKVFQVAPGYRGAKQISAAYAESQLRKRGALPPIEYRPNGCGKPWTDEEYDEAIAMRLSGKTHDEIAAILGRTRAAINEQIGHEAPLHGRA